MRIPGADPVGWYVDAFGRFPTTSRSSTARPGDQLRCPGTCSRAPPRPRPTGHWRTSPRTGLLGPFLTANFDRLLEQALAEAGRSDGGADLAGMDSARPHGQHGPLPGRCLKLHGDYLDLRIRNTHELRLGRRVAALDLRARSVTTADGTRIDYDALVLATGSSAFVPPVPGHDLPQCHVYRTLDDLDAIRPTPPARRPVAPRAWSSAVGCSGWRPPTRCAASGCMPMSWRWHHG